MSEFQKNACKTLGYNFDKCRFLSNDDSDNYFSFCLVFYLSIIENTTGDYVDIWVPTLKLTRLYHFESLVVLVGCYVGGGGTSSVLNSCSSIVIPFFKKSLTAIAETEVLGKTCTTV